MLPLHDQVQRSDATRDEDGRHRCRGPERSTPMSLKGKHALVTGGSRGIGRGIALKLAEQGARVAVHYYTNQSAAKDTLERVRKHGGNGILVQADVTQMDDVRQMFGEVRQAFGT